MRRTALLLAATGLLGFILPASTASAAAASRALNRTIPEVSFKGVTFGDALEFVRDVSAANIVVNWKALAEQNITQDTTVNLHLRQVSLRKALNLLLAEVGGGDQLGYEIDGGVVEITTRELADKKMYTRVYDVQDLLMEIPDFSDAPDFSLNSSSNSQGQSGGGGGSSGGAGGSQGTIRSVFGNQDSSSTGGNKEDAGKTRAERAQDLIQLIQDTISTEIWKDNGGNASIRFFNGSLIVTAPRAVHEAIGGDFD